MEGSEMAMVMVTKMQRLMTMVMMPWPPLIRVAARMVPSASSQSRSLPKVCFLRFLVALNVGSQIRLRVVNVDGLELVPHGTGAWYGQALPVPAVVKPSGVASRDALSPMCVENHLNDFYHFKISYLCPI
jgi:hypothetical protein